MTIEDPAVDPIGLIITEADDYLMAEANIHVRGRRYAGTKATENEPASPGDSPPFVIIRRLSRTRVKRHRQRLRISAVAFGVDSPDATRISLLVSDALHMIGPRLRASGLAIYLSREEVGGQPGQDPDTNWPTETSVFIVHAPAVAVASTP